MFENNDNFNLYHIEIIGGKDIPSSVENVPKSYIKMLEQTDKMKQIFNILKSEEKVLYFCNAGKDRTGVVTALILQSLGVSEEDIINDYILTKEYLKKTLEKYAGDNSELLNIITPKEEYMNKYFEYFKEKYRTINEYLKLLEISEKDIILLRKKYLS